jgi:hypothetical protein
MQTNKTLVRTALLFMDELVSNNSVLAAGGFVPRYASGMLGTCFRRNFATSPLLGRKYGPGLYTCVRDVDLSPPERNLQVI